MSKKVSRQIEENRRYISCVLPVEKSFDISRKDFLIAGEKSLSLIHISEPTRH